VEVLLTFLTSALDGSGQLQAQAALPLGKQAPYPLDRRMGEPQGRSGHYGEEKKPCPARNQTPVIQPAAKSLY